MAGVLLSGCLVVPLPGDETKVLRGSAVSDGQITKVEIGRTTRKEVEETLGRPFIIWEDQRIYAYDWDVAGMRLLWIIAAAATGGGVGGGVTGGTVDVNRNYVLLVQFNEQDVVIRINKTVRTGLENMGHHLVEWRNLPAAKSDQVRLKPGPNVSVMFRVQPQLMDGQTLEKDFRGWWGAHEALFSKQGLQTGAATFESGGVIVRAKAQRVPGATKQDGWYVVQLPVGLSYVALSASNGTDPNPTPPSVHFRIEVPPDTQWLYAGTVTVPVRITRALGWGWMTFLDSTKVSVTDESEAAFELLRRSGIRDARSRTLLFQLYDGPQIIRTPPASAAPKPPKVQYANGCSIE